MQIIKICCFRYSQKTRSFDLHKNYYTILNIKRNSTKAIIRNAYLVMAKKYHPDVNPNGKQKFNQVRQAYEVLSNEQERKEYDQHINSVNPQPQFASSKPNSGTARDYQQQYQKSYYARPEYQYEQFKGQRKMYTGYHQNFKAQEQGKGKTYAYDDIFSTNKWAKSFYQQIKSTLGIANPKQKKQNKKKTSIDIQYERVQFTHSQKNPFCPPDAPQQPQKINQVELQDIWKKFKSKIVG